MRCAVPNRSGLLIVVFYARGIIGDERADATLVLRLHQSLPAFFSRSIAFMGADFFSFQKVARGNPTKIPPGLN